jgi:hypothetical protein
MIEEPRGWRGKGRKRMERDAGGFKVVLAVVVGANDNVMRTIG